MKVIFGPQGDDSWWAVKRGIPSSSDFDKIITPVKGDLSKSADAYLDQLIADVMCQTPNYFTERGVPVNTYAVQQGQNLEPEARKWLAFDANLDVTEVSFCLNDEGTLGCSPDGVLGLEWAPDAGGEHGGQPWYAATLQGTVELKVPLRHTHVGYLRKGKLPDDYKPQVHGHLVITGAAYCEFVSYARDLPPLRVRVERDEYTDKVEAATRELVGLYREALEKVRSHQ